MTRKEAADLLCCSPEQAAKLLAAAGLVGESVRVVTGGKRMRSHPVTEYDRAAVFELARARAEKAEAHAATLRAALEGR